MTVWSYKVARDYGFAPNPFHGVCTLACCKPLIRGHADIGDWVIGAGSKANGLWGKIVYAMIVDETLTFDQYWNDHRFQVKKPVIGGTHKGFSATTSINATVVQTVFGKQTRTTVYATVMSTSTTCARTPSMIAFCWHGNLSTLVPTRSHRLRKPLATFKNHFLVMFALIRATHLRCSKPLRTGCRAHLNGVCTDCPKHGITPSRVSANDL